MNFITGIYEEANPIDGITEHCAIFNSETKELILVIGILGDSEKEKICSLFAASADLYEACKEAENALRIMASHGLPAPYVAEKLRKAIAKVEG